SPRRDAPADRAGDPPGAGPDSRRGREAQPRRRREDHAQVVDRRRPAASDRRGTGRDRLLRARREQVVAAAHRIYARALFQAAQDKDKLELVHGQMQQLRDAVSSVDDLRSLLQNPEIESTVKADILARVAKGADDE